MNIKTAPLKKKGDWLVYLQSSHYHADLLQSKLPCLFKEQFALSSKTPNTCKASQ